MYSAALFGAPLGLRGAGVCGVHVYALLCLLCTAALAWGGNDADKQLPERVVLWERPAEDGRNQVGGRSPQASRQERQVRQRREDSVNVTGDAVGLNASTTDFVTDGHYYTSTETTNSSILTSEAPPSDGDGQGAGAIVGAIFGVLLGGAILGGALYLLFRYKRAQAAEYNRSVQVHMSSTRNAGVYVDLAEPSDLPSPGRDYTSLKQQNNAKGGQKDKLMHSDLYEYDSEDEVCVYD